MSVNRIKEIPGFSIDQVAAAAGNNPEILRLENLDTDLIPPQSALEATRNAVGKDDFNSYLPFTGNDILRELVAQKISRETKKNYQARQTIITCGGTEGMFDALLATTDIGDEVVLTDPTYAGMINRVRLAGGKPVLVPFELDTSSVWRLDLHRLAEAITPKTRVLFIMNPSMPSGAVLNQDEWKVICDLCIKYNLWLIYNAAMERIVYDGKPVIHPASFPGMEERTIIVGSLSKEYCMIGWRVGWVAGPQEIMNHIGRVHIYNVVTPTGITQAGAIEALKTSDEYVRENVAVWESRRNVVNQQLSDYPIISAAGGWSQLLDTGKMGLSAMEASKMLLEKGKIAATAMDHWGEKNSSQYLRLVFSNEKEERLSELKNRFRQTFES